ncbi:MULTISPECIES: XrtA-associated tyrosine autokinase [unclassified Colwellia]|uniref:XrtA-associated tyrosine autokinase n=1 Tax=unclassified Colwellia TaxID=196834 RepID=UPI0015F76256|nr:MULTISPECIES: XrtA-associated tyrosine autokinase [unclassified Colwellia]MBA6252589.1 tyrosine-protein kinase family protein [Colwellia sp. MB3u-55]MBA6397185.1 tyrosine-protein kinase family protein [Colwellia sp. BRX10-4]
MSTIEKALAKQKMAQQDKTPVVTESVTIDKPTKAVESSTASVTYENNDVLVLNKSDLESRGFLIDNGTRKSIKDEFRQIKRKLLNNAFGSGSKTLKNSNLVMISSSKPNEGKTFISINLALSIALEQDKTVLLIDADVLRPSINRELGFKQVPGLIEYLLGDKQDISEIMYSTNIDKLKIIPAGEPHHLSNELLASDRMESLAKELAERYPDRIVIFDCPPLIGVTETMVLANLMGQALVVVEESKTLLADIEKATENLNEDLALGLVLNKAIRSHKDMYGYYGYGYGTK